MKNRILAFLFCLALVFSFLLSSLRSRKLQAEDLMSEIKPNSITSETDITRESSNAITDFGLRLFRQCIEENNSENKNTLISPLSVIYALSMTANGSDGDTLAQIEKVLGLPVDELNRDLHSYMNHLPADKKYKLSIANSIWFADDDSFTVEQDFLQMNADLYGAGLYKAPFDDSTRKDINSWVEENTDGMIKEIVDSIPQEAVMYLVNAIAFDAEWNNIYKEDEVRKDTFTKEDQTQEDVRLMYSSEYNYLEDSMATGFIKYYKDQKYAFAALLPNNGISIEDYVSSLNGGNLHELLSNPQSVHVNAAIPQFENSYDAELSETLGRLGMSDAFDPSYADFSGIGHSAAGNIYINRVLHKTFISVDEKGTKAGAATAAEMVSESAMSDGAAESKTVYLNRPFLYMLIDCEANLPIFVGVTMDIDK